jgi:hypothetical protein
LVWAEGKAPFGLLNCAGSVKEGEVCCFYIAADGEQAEFETMDANKEWLTILKIEQTGKPFTVDQMAEERGSQRVGCDARRNNYAGAAADSPAIKSSAKRA